MEKKGEGEVALQPSKRVGGSAPVAGAVIHCPRCGHVNPSQVRFCNGCGLDFSSSKPSHFSPALEENAVATSAKPLGPECWACHKVGEVGAEFCKFCGARYAEGSEKQGAISPSGSKEVGVAPTPQRALSPLINAITPSNPTFSVLPRAVSNTSKSYGALVLILKDGSDGQRFPIVEVPTDIGRSEGQIVLGDDPYLSPRHVRLVPQGEGLLIRDLDSVNGVYVRLREPIELTHGDMILLGQHLFRFEILPELEAPLGPAVQRGVLVFGTPEVAHLARLVQYTTEGIDRDIHYLHRDETIIGREQGDIVCAHDLFMSRRHAAIVVDRTRKRFTLRDLGSSNGTAVRIRGERLIHHGDHFRVGRHLFRYDREG
ncbi:MAG: FHA domain-containing protein [Sandaracinaceae bacterium]|nr:FHA domain-containing protein [Sandaracinaceae bacterium]MDW8245077.1 FHA domain-containing protein [Sandaracinaceae bacterium]